MPSVEQTELDTARASILEQAGAVVGAVALCEPEGLGGAHRPSAWTPGSTGLREVDPPDVRTCHSTEAVLRLKHCFWCFDPLGDSSEVVEPPSRQRGYVAVLPIVGVVRDVRTMGLSVAPRPVVYEVGGTWPTSGTVFTYVMRMADGSRPVVDWPRILRPIDPTAVVLSDETVGERLSRSVRDRTFATLVIGLFAAASLLVTALGLAGVVAYTVVKRTREIAVRLTLGATRRGVLWIIARDALTAAGCGALAGIIASVWLSRTLESLLYGVRAADPPTLFLAAVSLLGIVVGAAILPAIRTGRIEPAIALRIE